MEYGITTACNARASAALRLAVVLSRFAAAFSETLRLKNFIASLNPPRTSAWHRSAVARGRAVPGRGELAKRQGAALSTGSVDLLLSDLARDRVPVEVGPAVARSAILRAGKP